MQPRIIALYSARPGAGKTTAACWLALRRHYTRVSFATPIKTMLEDLLQRFDLTCAQCADYLHGAHKNAPIPGLGVSARELMQTLGSTWGRGCVHPNLWVWIAQSHIEDLLANGCDVVVDDLRLPNEYDMLHALGAQFYAIERPDTAAPPTPHPCPDGALAGYPFDGILHNTASHSAFLDTLQHTF